MLAVIANFTMGALALGLFWATTTLGRRTKNRMTGAGREANTVS